MYKCSAIKILCFNFYKFSMPIFLTEYIINNWIYLVVTISTFCSACPFISIIIILFV